MVLVYGHVRFLGAITSYILMVLIMCDKCAASSFFGADIHHLMLLNPQHGFCVSTVLYFVGLL